MANSKDTTLNQELQAALINNPLFMVEIMQKALQSVIDGQFDQMISAKPYERSEYRQGQRNGQGNCMKKLLDVM